MAIRTQPTMSPSYSTKLTEAMTLSPSSFQDEGTDSEDEETASEGQQQQAIMAEDAAEDEPLGLGYTTAKRRDLERARDTMSSTYEVGQSSRSIPDQQLETSGETPTQTHVRLPIRTTWEDPEDGTIYMEIDILHTHSERLDVLPPSRFEGYDRDVTELFSRTRAVREEIHSQHFRLRSLERGQEETGITIGTLWRPILALEACVGYTDTQRGALWQAIYEDRWEIYNLRRHHTADQREMQELKERITALEQRMDHKEE
ncbi:hypothetical protein Tco_0212540 [Tanacetum coccineum]